MRHIFILTLAFFLFPPAALAHGHAAVPEMAFGFERESLVKTKFLITDLEFSPAGTIWLLDKNGGVYEFIDGRIESVLKLWVDSEKERGLLGMAFDPDFLQNGYFYLYYTTGLNSRNYSGSPKNRLSRFQFSDFVRKIGAAMTQPTDVLRQATEEILLDNIPADSGMHNGGGIKIGPDGKLYVPTGDGGAKPKNASDLSSLGGKILRLNLDGTAPSDNPFVGRKGARPEVWAYGLRNPWRISFDSLTGKLYASDVGGGLAEEVNFIERGKNYGWPLTEGYLPAGVKGVTYPAYAYKHGKKGASIIGGEVYRGTTFPKEYQGRYFFADFVTYQIQSVDLAAKKPAASTIVANACGVIDLNFGSDGALYAAVGDSPFSGHVEKIFYTGKAKPTHVNVAAFASATSGQLPLKVDFRVDGETDTKRFKYNWDFGDGIKGSGTKVEHIYKAKGQYDARLAVTYKDEVIIEDTVKIFAGNRPPKAKISTVFRGQYIAGQKIELLGTAQDPEDGKLPNESFSWNVVLAHGSHQHPFFTDIKGDKLSLVAPTEGESDHDVYLLATLTVIDKEGLSAVKQFELRPQKTSVTLRSNIKGVELMLDGKAVKTPYSFKNVVAFPREISAPDEVQISGREYKFVRWSNGGSREQKIVPTAKNQKFVAIYKLVK